MVAIVLLIGAGMWVGQSAGFSPADVSERFRALGAWQVPAFVGAFALWVLAALPGSLFVLAAPVLFGHTLGFLLAYTGTVIAVTLPFLLARAGRGSVARPAAFARWKRLERLLATSADR